MTKERLTRQLCTWVAKNSAPYWIQPFPAWTVNSHELLEYLSELTGFSWEQLADWVEEATKKETTPI